MLQVSALRARHDRASLSLAQNRDVVGHRAGALSRPGHVRSAGRDAQVVDDRGDHVFDVRVSRVAELALSFPVSLAIETIFGAYSACRVRACWWAAMVAAQSS
jgi:hypothetical protein